MSQEPAPVPQSPPSPASGAGGLATPATQPTGVAAAPRPAGAAPTPQAPAPPARPVGAAPGAPAATGGEPGKADPQLFGKLVLANKMATQEQVLECLAIQRTNPTKPLGMLMVEMGYLRKDHLEQLLAMLRMRQPAAAPKEPTPAVGKARETMDQLLRQAADLKVSDLHVNVGSPPIVRLNGSLRNANHPPLTADQTREMLLSLLTEEQKGTFFQNKDLDFCLTLGGAGRFRANIFHHRNGIDGSFRYIPARIPTLSELGIPTVIEKLTHFGQGLILVTGPAGSGKTTTLAALMQLVNQSRKDNIICLEQPIEYLIPSASCNVVQREIPRDSLSFANALRGALREDPDVIMIGEMRDLDTISIAITAAETGHLVLGSLHTSSAARTVDRILDVFPPKEAAQVRAMVSESLRGVVSQQLVPRADGKGRVAACEILFNTPAIANLIRDERTFQIPGQMQTGRKLGMQRMDDALQDLVRRKIITLEEGMKRAENKATFTAA